MIRPAGIPICMAVMLLASCATGGPVAPGQPTQAAEHYRVEPQIQWTRMARGPLELWTVDGPQLQQLRFYRAIGDGESLLPEAGRSSGGIEDQRPKYRGWMRAHDVMQMVADTLAQSGAIHVRTKNLRPADFGDRDGFRFELTFASPAGLAYCGLAQGMIDDQQRLHLILYTGTEQHYYDAYRDEVERILASVTLL